MHAKIIAIGTSKGIRIPKYLLDKYHFENLVDIDEMEEGLLIKPMRHPRDGWSAAFNKVAGSENDRLIDMPDSEFDVEDWEW